MFLEEVPGAAQAAMGSRDSMGQLTRMDAFRGSSGRCLRFSVFPMTTMATDARTTTMSSHLGSNHLLSKNEPTEKNSYDRIDMRVGSGRGETDIAQKKHVGRITRERAEHCQVSQ